jgi:hypothetical protein
MKKRLLQFGFLAAVLFLPTVAFAAKDLKYIIKVITDYMSIFILLIISLAVLTFIWNVYLYFFTEKDKKEAGMYVLYSVIGFFVILSFWGLVNILSNSLNLDTQQPKWPFGVVNNPGGSSQPGDVTTGPRYSQPGDVTTGSRP